MENFILVLGVSIVFIGVFYKFFSEKIKMNSFFFKKNAHKFFVLSLLFLTICIVISFMTYFIGLHFNFRYVGKPIFGRYFYNPLIWFKFMRIESLNQIYLFSTSMICISSIPFLIYMLKNSGDETLDTHGTARWAKLFEWEVAGLIFPKDKLENGVILGKTKFSIFGGYKYIIDTLKTHVAVIAPSRAGKGIGIIIPTLLHWISSVFVLDMKGENYQKTAGFRKYILRQKVLKFKPYGLNDSVSYNPLGEVRIGTPYEVKDATIIADILTDPGEGKKRDHWDTSASALFVGLILHVLYMRKRENKVGTFGDIVDFLTSTEDTLENNFLNLLNFKHLNEEDITKISEIYEESQLKGINRSTHPIVARTAAEILNKDERERASVISSVMSKLGLFKDPIIRKNTSRVDFKINDLMNYEVPVSFYVCVEAEQMDTLGPLLRMLITQIIGILCPEMDFSSNKQLHKHKLLLMLDEFPAFGTIPLLESALAYIAGYGIKAVVIAQALNQIKKKYGEKNSVFDNCATTVFYAPTPLDTETPKQVSEMLGDKTIRVKSKSYKAFQLGGINISESNQARRLLTPEEVKNKVSGKWNIISTIGLYPLMGVKLEYFKEKYFIPKTNEFLGIPETDYLYNTDISSVKNEIMSDEELEKENKALFEKLENMEDEVIFENLENVVLEERKIIKIIENLEDDTTEIVDPEEDY